jgi:hypothetical protein
VNQTPNYTDRTVEELDAIKNRILSTVVARAETCLTRFSEAQSQLATAKDTFLGDPTVANGEALVEAHKKLFEATVLANAIDEGGGSSYLGEVALRSEAVDALFERAFAAKILVLEKLPAPARQRLGARLATLAEAGVHPAAAANDPFVLALNQYLEAVRQHVAVAVFGQKFCACRGVGHQPKSFDELRAELGLALPLMAMIPA